MAENNCLPSYVVRPGVTFPDWSAITSHTARDALLAIFQAENIETRWRDYTLAEDRVRVALLGFYAEQGRAPTLSELADRVGLDESAVDQLLGSLQRRDLVVLDSDGERIIGAYPFSDRDTGHHVTLGDRTLTAMCAIDVLGIGAMLDRDTEIRTACRYCSGVIQVTTCEHGRKIAGAQPATTVVWAGLWYEHGCAADSLCKVLVFFCGDDHLDAWRRAGDPNLRGVRLSIEEALEVGCAMFGPSLIGTDTKAFGGRT